MTAPERPQNRGRIVAIGEALIDLVHRADGRIDESPGGSPANVALTLGRLGDAPLLIAGVGQDPHGALISAWLAESDVELRAIMGERTATASAHLDEDGSATYDFDIEWTLPGELDVTDAGILHTGSIAAFLRPGADAVQRLAEATRDAALITFDPNTRPALIPDRNGARLRAEAFAALADVVKASDEDLEWLYPGQDPLDSAAAWQRSGPAIVVVTHGGEGASAVTANGVTRVPGRPVQVVDTVGAGDTFMGALIHGVFHAGYTDARSRGRLKEIEAEALQQILRFAATAAAITVSRPGADPPRLDEVPTL